jgi:hypothetical protein
MVPLSKLATAIHSATNVSTALPTRYLDATVVTVGTAAMAATHVATGTTTTRTVTDLHATTAMVVVVDVAAVGVTEGTEDTTQTNTAKFACGFQGDYPAYRHN